MIKEKSKGIYGKRTTFFRDHKFNNPKPIVFYKDEVNYKEPDIYNKSDEYWEENRFENLSKDELCEIAVKIGADVPFFVYEYDSANVTGIGEIVKKFDEEVLNIDTITPKIKCNTGEIFTIFREKYYKEISKEESIRLLNMKSLDILNELDIKKANDSFLYRN